MSSRNTWKNPALYKSRLCDNWSNGTTCKFGLKCWYAHGPDELRHVTRLDNDPVARSVSLAQVVGMLPPSKNRTNAVSQVEGLMTDFNSELFQRFTVPYLNNLVFRMVSEQKKSPGESAAFDMEALGQSLMKMAAAQPQPKSTSSPVPWEQEEKLSDANEEKMLRPRKVELDKKNLSSSSLHTVSSTLSNDSFPSKRRSSNSSGVSSLHSDFMHTNTDAFNAFCPDEDFKEIYQRVNNDCNTFF